MRAWVRGLACGAVRAALIAAAALAASACASLSTLQTAEIIDEGTGEIVVNAAVSGGGLAGSLLGAVPAVYPAIEVHGRYGFTSFYEGSFKFSPQGVLQVGNKLRLLRRDPFALAVGLVAGWNLGFGVHLPLYASVRPLDKLAVYVTPQYVLFVPDGHVLAGTVGVKVGERVGFVGEATIGRYLSLSRLFREAGIDVSVTSFQVAGGVFLSLGTPDPDRPPPNPKQRTQP